MTMTRKLTVWGRRIPIFAVVVAAFLAVAAPAMARPPENCYPNCFPPQPSDHDGTAAFHYLKNVLTGQKLADLYIDHHIPMGPVVIGACSRSDFGGAGCESESFNSTLDIHLVGIAGTALDGVTRDYVISNVPTRIEAACPHPRVGVIPSNLESVSGAITGDSLLEVLEVKAGRDQGLAVSPGTAEVTLVRVCSNNGLLQCDSRAQCGGGICDVTYNFLNSYAVTFQIHWKGAAAGLLDGLEGTFIDVADMTTGVPASSLTGTDTIPTLSSWGIVALALTLATVGSLILLRRRSARSHPATS